MLARQFDLAAETGTSVDARIPVQTADGRDIWVHVVGRRFQPEGEPIQLIGALRDITAQIATERKLSELAKAALAANKAKDAFLANMSHEIRTPLNGVVGLAAAMLATPLEPRQREMVSLIHSSSETLERLLSDLLDLSKVEAGHIDVQSAPFDLQTSIETAALLMRSRADSKHLAFSVNYGPEAAGQFVGDAVRIRQIVANLASNAVKFTQAGRVDIHVDVVGAPTAGAAAELHVTVRDTGIGFDDATAARLFQRFEQADDSITRSFGGTGLGLAISRVLARTMGGDITAWSEPGVGSVFTLTLPLIRADSGTSAAHLAQAQAQTLDLAPREVDTPEAHVAIRLLLAEDNLVNQRAMSLMLEPRGVDLSIADHGLEAVAAFGTHPFDVVLMDMQMPRMDGLAATREIRRLETERGGLRTPIVMVSANAMKEHVQMALEAGCDFHLAKPVTPANLVEMLTRALELAETWAEALHSDALTSEAAPSGTPA